MNWFKNMKIRLKLLSSFIVVILLTVVVAGVGIFALSKVDSTYSYLLDYPSKRYNAMSEIKFQIMGMRRAFINFGINGGEKGGMDAVYAEVRSSLDQLEKSIQQFKTLTAADTNYDNTEKQSIAADADKILSACKTYFNEDVTKLYNLLYAENLSNDEIRPYYDAAAVVIQPAIDLADTRLAAAEKAVDDANASTSSMAESILWVLVAVSILAAVVAFILAMVVAGIITKPLVKLVNVAGNVADGNLNINIDTGAKDETGDMSRAFSEVVATINRIMQDIEAMHKKHDAGEMNQRMDAAAYKGAYSEVVDGVNNMVNSYIEMVEDVLGSINDIAHGNLDTKLEQYKGQKAEVNKDMTAVINTIRNIAGSIADVAKQGTDGNLAIRADANKFEGEWSQILHGLNSLMDGVSAAIADALGGLSELSRGNFAYRITNNYKGDYDKIKQATNSTSSEIDSYISEVSRILEAMAAGDLTKDITRDYIGQFTAIKESINQISKSLNSTMQEITSASGQVLTGARQISQSSMLLAQGATEQASAVQELNAMVDEINNQTQDNANNAQQASKLASASKSNAETGNEEMQELLKAMEGITQASTKISNIIKTIEDIASQTNLLALNAAVEAARAGEHGKGFTVVAGEVRSLADKSRQAAQETNNLIQESIQRVSEGTKRANETAGSLGKIVGNVVDVSDVISKIYDASMRQAEAIGNVGIGLGQISQVVQSNSATSEESAAAAQELNSQSETLQQMISFFKTK